jgi:hypothetical protein
MSCARRGAGSRHVVDLARGLYAAYVATVVESFIIDIDHWRHYSCSSACCGG